MFERLFLTHPRSVGESYLEHQRAAFGFAGALLLATCACALHALVPALCERTGSKIIGKLHDRLVVNRRRAVASDAPAQPQPWADYAI